MSNQFFEFKCIDLNGQKLRFRRQSVKAIAIKENVLATQLLIVTKNGSEYGHLMADAPDAIREFVLTMKEGE